MEARVLNQNEEDKENNPSENVVLQTTLSRLQSDLQELRQTVAEKDNEISRVNLQFSDALKQIEELVGIY